MDCWLSQTKPKKRILLVVAVWQCRQSENYARLSLPCLMHFAGP